MNVQKVQLHHTSWHGWRAYGTRLMGCSSLVVASSRRPHWNPFEVSKTYYPDYFHLNRKKKKKTKFKTQIEYAMNTSLLFAKLFLFSLSNQTMTKIKNQNIKLLAYSQLTNGLNTVHFILILISVQSSSYNPLDSVVSIRCAVMIKATPILSQTRINMYRL